MIVHVHMDSSGQMWTRISANLGRLPLAKASGMSPACDVVPSWKYGLGEVISLLFRQQVLQVLDSKSISDSAQYQDSLDKDLFGKCQPSVQAFQMSLSFP